MTNISPTDRAIECLDHSAKGWMAVFPDRPIEELKRFVLETAKNDILELQIRRMEIFKPIDAEYKHQYWEAVKIEIELLMQVIIQNETITNVTNKE